MLDSDEKSSNEGGNTGNHMSCVSKKYVAVYREAVSVAELQKELKEFIDHHHIQIPYGMTIFDMDLYDISKWQEMYLSMMEQAILNAASRELMVRLKLNVSE
jgi:transcription termination factor NusB